MKKRVISGLCCLVGLLFVLLSYIECESTTGVREVKVVHRSISGFWDGKNADGSPTGGRIYDIDYIYEDSQGFCRLSNCTTIEDIEVGDTTTLESEVDSGLNLTLFSIGIPVLLVSFVIFIISFLRSENNSEDSLKNL